MGHHLLPLGISERESPVGVVALEGRKRPPVAADRPGEEVFECGERPRGMVEHLLIGRRDVGWQPERCGGTARPLRVGRLPQLEPAVEHDAIILERPVGHIAALHIRLEGRHALGDRRVGVGHPKFGQNPIDLPLAARVERPRMAVEEAAGSSDAHMSLRRDRADEHVTGDDVHMDRPRCREALD